MKCEACGDNTSVVGSWDDRGLRVRVRACMAKACGSKARTVEMPLSRVAEVVRVLFGFELARSRDVARGPRRRR